VSSVPSNRTESDYCAACGKRLTDRYFTLIDRRDRYCPNCIATRPRCATCGAPLGDNHWQLHDGRRQCARCHQTGVYDPAQAQTIFDETVSGLITQFDMRLNVGVAFRLVDAPALEALRAEGGDRPAAGQHTLGLYHRRGHLRTIYMLYGLPRLIFRTTVAHEYAHAWQGERCPLLRDDELREGFAEWIAYHHLRWLGCTLAAGRMLNAQHPYRPALDRVLDLERRIGTQAVVEYIQRAE
jgi:hypothetical protein